MVYCIPNAPNQNGDLWVKVVRNRVVVLDPAGEWWRGKKFTIEQFRSIFKEVK
jgi:hypothetical protein